MTSAKVSLSALFFAVFVVSIGSASSVVAEDQTKDKKEKQGISSDKTMGQCHVYEVKDVKLSLIKTNPPKLSIIAHGSVETTGYTDPELIKVTYVMPPMDGLQGFNFCAKPPQGGGSVLPVITPITATFEMSEIPKWLKGVRVTAKTNAVEEKLK